MDLGLGLLKDAFGIVSRVANRQADDLLIYDLKWPEKIGLKKDLEAKGYRINWSRLDEIHDRLQEGYKYVTVPYGKWWQSATGANVRVGLLNAHYTAMKLALLLAFLREVRHRPRCSLGVDLLSGWLFGYGATGKIVAAWRSLPRPQ